MIRTSFLPILLTAAMIAQTVIVGWGHSHAHLGDGSHGDLNIAGHSHHHHAASGHHHVHFHVHAAREHSSLPNQPADQENCSICRHLALAAIVAFELEALSVGDAPEAVQERESALVPTITVGLYRPRSPPELS